MPRVLLTAFEPFGGAEVNTSLVVAEALAAAHDWVLLRLPVVRGQAESLLIARLSTAPAPLLVISLGEADDAPQVRLEKVALNWDDFRIPDNAGNQPRDTTIDPTGPAAYFATVGVAEIARELAGKTPLPVVVSLTAGAFVCNHLSYAALHYLAARPVCPFLFIHVPRWRPGSSDGLSLEAITETVESVVEAAEHVDTSRRAPL